MTRLRSWCRFVRLDSAPLTMGAPVIGALVRHPTLPAWHIAILAAIGLSAHVFGFVLNDVIDWELDQENPAQRGKPLLRGFVARSTAAGIALAQIPVSLLMSLLLPHYTRTSSLLLLSAFGLAAVYDVFGKRLRRFPPMADLSLGASEGVLLIWGAVASRGSVTTLVVLVGLCLGMQMTLVNILMSLKDLGPDLAFGARTTPIWLGVRVGSKGEIAVSGAMRVGSLLLAFAGLAVYGMTLVCGLWELSSSAVWAVVSLSLLSGGAALLALVRFLWITPRQLLAQVYFDLVCLALLIALAARVGALAMAQLAVVLLTPFLVTSPYKAAALIESRRTRNEAGNGRRR